MTEVDHSSAAVRRGWFEPLLAACLARYPQHAGLLARLVPRPSPDVHSMAVTLATQGRPGGPVVLLVNRTYFESHPHHALGILLHELHHVAFGHLEDPRFFRVAYPRVMELAMELGANEPILESLPETVYHVERYTRFGVRRGQSTLERYRILEEAYGDGRLRDDDLPDQRRSPLDERRTVDVHRLPGGAGRGLGDRLDAAEDRSTAENWSRDPLLAEGDGPGFDELRFMRELLQDHLAGAGTDGAYDVGGAASRPRAKEIERPLLGPSDAPRLDWARTLERAFALPRTVTSDYRRPNRRFPRDVGRVPGRRRRRPRLRLLAAVDTSGSMDASLLERVAGELRHLARAARITVVECDASLHRSYPPQRLGDAFVGGGDTAFEPVLRLAEGTPGLDGVVYFTDGRGLFGPEPSVPTLWVVPPGGSFRAPWGTVVELPR